MKSFRRNTARIAERGRRRGKAGQRVLEARRMESGDMGVRPPMEWEHLITMVIHRRIEGRIEQVDLFQGSRANNYHVRSDARVWCGVSATRLAEMLRRRWKLRWLVE
jgi:hypothetical protein